MENSENSTNFKHFIFCTDRPKDTMDKYTFLMKYEYYFHEVLVYYYLVETVDVDVRISDH